MNAFIFKPSNESVGKIKIDTFDELLEKLAAFRASNPEFPTYSYIEASGRTWTIVSLDPLQLKEGRIADWVESANSSGEYLDPLQLKEGRIAAPPVALPSASTAASATSPQPSDVVSRSVVSRYRDAYFVARATTAIGAIVKNIAIGLGLLIAVAAGIAGSQNHSSGQFFVGGVFLGTIIATPLYVLGVLVSAHGQVLKATLDTAVHSSPFLKKEDMAKVMSL